MAALVELQYSTIALVLESWDDARFGSENFDAEVGMVALQRLFVLQPRAKVVFGFNEGEEIGKRRSTVHAKGFADFFDSIFQMLGPDVEFMQQILRQIGIRHRAMGVSPSFFPFMGQALIFAIESFLGKELNDAQREAWELVFEAISNEIIRTILST